MTGLLVAMAQTEKLTDLQRTAEAAGVVAAGRVGIVDIGSNTVRLVVYETHTKLPIPIFNEKAQCALARDMGKTGQLSARGVSEALRSLARFSRLARAMGVSRLELVATAAVRDASDGAVFVEQVEKVSGHPVHVLSGAEEARLAAVGLLNGVPDADGLLGDLGGGSLDLVGLDRGQIGNFATFRAGHLRLAEEAGWDRQKARLLMDTALRDLPWLADMSGRSVYAVGGSWRGLARFFIEQTHHPLHVLDNYTVSFLDTLKLSRLIADLSESMLQKLTSVRPGRLDTLPYAAIALSALIETARPDQVVFSGFGMREGQMLELLPPDLRPQDSLISACEFQARRTGRFAIHGQEILDWMTPLFPGETGGQRRLRLAICLLSDIGWTEHPDYRAHHAYQRVLRIPYPGLTHPDRALMALATFVRYGRDIPDPLLNGTPTLLDESGVALSRTIGLALRLAHTLSGGAPGLLAQTRLKVEKDRLILLLPADKAVFLSDAVDRRLKQLAASKGLKAKIG
jgi:exopolyphosphatase / guanosine-5'-triphosphate,3'-diphosphate pyrophosphatase